jgi:hypothetical protein
MAPDLLRDRVSQKLSTAGAIRHVEAWPDSPVALGKPTQNGQQGNPLMMTPIRLSISLIVQDQPEMSRILAKGVGRGKAFGFGLLMIDKIDRTPATAVTESIP